MASPISSLKKTKKPPLFPNNKISTQDVTPRTSMNKTPARLTPLEHHSPSSELFNFSTTPLPPALSSLSSGYSKYDSLDINLNDTCMSSRVPFKPKSNF
jgi:hypothetical protein